MNRMTILALPLSCLLAMAGCASTGGNPADVDLTNAQVAVRTEKNGDTIEEYRVAGNLRMVKVTPSRGAPYFLYDSDGDGRLDKSKDNSDISPVYWKLYGW
jgi:outer membrane biogenesis lipoprotein LolB